jgi:hypothetical protein
MNITSATCVQLDLQQYRIHQDRAGKGVTILHDTVSPQQLGLSGGVQESMYKTRRIEAFPFGG